MKGVITQLNGSMAQSAWCRHHGTNLGGKIFVGDAWYGIGPDRMHAANATPRPESRRSAVAPLQDRYACRVHRRSIGFSISWNASPATRNCSLLMSKENQKTTSDFDALDPRERGCSPLSDPKGEVETEKS